MDILVRQLAGGLRARRIENEMPGKVLEWDELVSLSGGDAQRAQQNHKLQPWVYHGG